jgi:hypothetical protein
MPVLFQVPPANSASNNRPDEDWGDIMLPPVENTAAQGQPQVLPYGGRGVHYASDMANDIDVPAQAQAGDPPVAPVCPDPIVPSAYTYLTQISR